MLWGDAILVESWYCWDHTPDGPSMEKWCTRFGTGLSGNTRDKRRRRLVLEDGLEEQRSERE